MKLENNELRNLFNAYRAYYEALDSISPDTRKPNFPEVISQNLVGRIIEMNGDREVDYQPSSGDLMTGDQKVEVKAFISDGPTTFGPKEAWDEIYFFDARDFVNEHFLCYKVSFSNTDGRWKSI